MLSRIPRAVDLPTEDTVKLNELVLNGVIKENEFRNKINTVDWSIYKDKKVMIKGWRSAPVPTWSYLIITAQLAVHAEQILYGEPCSAVQIFKRKK